MYKASLSTEVRSDVLKKIDGDIEILYNFNSTEFYCYEGTVKYTVIPIDCRITVLCKGSSITVEDNGVSEKICVTLDRCERFVIVGCGCGRSRAIVIKTQIGA